MSGQPSNLGGRMSGLIYKKMAAIMAEVEPIAKAQKNTQQNYQFRGIDDIYQGVQAIMAKHGVFSVPEVIEDRTEERSTKSGTALIYRILKIRYTFFAEDGSSVPAVLIGEGMDSGDKASNKAMSAAEKYSLIQAFKIPTKEAKDSEHDSHEDLAAKRITEQFKQSHTTGRQARPAPPPQDIPPPDHEDGSFEDIVGNDPGDYEIKHKGGNIGKRIRELTREQIMNDLNFWAGKKSADPGFFKAAKEYLASL